VNIMPSGEERPNLPTDERVKLEPELTERDKLLDLAREAVIVVDREGKILLWNEGAEQLYGWSEEQAMGKSPLQMLQTQLPRPLAQIENILRREPHWDAELKQTTRQGTRITVASRWALWRDDSGRELGHFQLDTDITRRKQVEHELRVLSGRLLTIRDEERRRWARELHDSVGQLLVGVTMNLSLLQQQIETDSSDGKLLAEGMRLTTEALREIRTISYLLHPPMLDEVGLVSAVRWYAAGFSERSQIKVEVEIEDSLGRFRKELEIAVFRIVQEALSNVHRHSKSDTARIEISARARQLRVKVEDRGKGITSPQGGDGGELTPGVGISGIRERVRQLGGHMQIRSGQSGTAVDVVFPLEQADLKKESVVAS
jgi:PAS domain S-box-containing protein